MKHHYRDIRDKISDQPIWWDENGTPRYCNFAPDVTADIYAKEAVLLLISCQACGYKFHVAMTRNIIDHVNYRPTLLSMIENRTIHYGDPPNIGCCSAGASMNSVPMKVIEYWSYDNRSFKWEKLDVSNVDLVPNWAK